ncbi:hypothetical protein [Halorientalis pallida]|uniref:PH domain-containing protein n=1 Tax=Halorientalis pallida TaxID=2479928 RepID=A0A498L0P5_9EURY|nr:hypothetical protein [Halorientalis pallida]RXK51627.1 hypothetical protein EAF64_03070 [Halorientalis pallida]
MHETVRQPALQSPDRPDTVFALVAGLYVALLVSPAVVFTATVAIPLGAGGLYIGLLATVTALTAAVTVAVGRMPGIAERLGASRFVRGLGVVAGLCTIGYGVAAAGVDASGTDGALIAGIGLSVVGIVTGLALVAMSRTRYATAVVDGDAVRATWKAGWPQPLRTRVQVGGLICYVGGMALLWGGEFVGLGRLSWLGGPAFVVGGAFLGLGQPRSYRLDPVGVERSNYIHRRLYEWDAFESFSVTEDAIVLRRAGWWQPDFRCWRDEIDDEDELLDALAESLPRA